MKVLVQTITMVTIVAIVMVVKYFNMAGVQNLGITKNIKQEFKKNSSYESIKKSTIKTLDKIYSVISPIIPKSLEDYFKNTEKKEEQSLAIYSEVKTKEAPKVEKGVGAAVQEKKVVTASSSISIESEILNKIKSTKIKFVLPTKGVISSRFGDREKIFEGIDTYHTGLDIAAEKGTEVLSSIGGIVTVSDYNEYNGNFIEITNGKVTTKYCHLDKKLVKKDQKVKAGKRIGKMGSTGLSTGPHLHFEIVYDGTRIDPQKVLNI